MAEGEFLLFSQLITGFVPVLSGVGFTAFVSAFFEKRTVGRLLAAGCGYLACCFISGGRMVSLPLVLLMLALAAGKLDVLSPLKALSRGYAVVYHEGKAVRDLAQLEEGEEVLIQVEKGKRAAKLL